MALGDNNTFNSEPFRPVTYGYGMNNPDAKYEKTSLSFAIWKFMLKVTIAPKVNDGGTYDKYDKDNGVSIYLNVNKAITLMKILDEFKELYMTSNKLSNNSFTSTITIDEAFKRIGIKAFKGGTFGGDGINRNFSKEDSQSYNFHSISHHIIKTVL